MFSDCPHLPIPRAEIDWKLLHAHRDSHRGEEFYLDCLEYAHALWRQHRAARAILCLDRAFGADLKGDEAVLRKWPLPYAALAWILKATPTDVFIGNPRVHFQHYAGRMNEPRREQRQWRAWAGWAIARAVSPQLLGDPRHVIEEPSLEAIAAGLERSGFAGESAVWTEVLNGLG